MAEPRTVLLVEDDPQDAFFMREAFHRAAPGLRLDVADNGEDAVAYLGRNRPDHVLLDLKLPRLSGLEVLSWLRGPGGLPDLPVTVLSGSDLPADIEAVKRLGIRGYLTKPVALKDLVAAVARFVKDEDLVP